MLAAAPGIRYLSEPDEGQSDAINKGLAMAEGDLIGWLGADDALTPDALDAVVAAEASAPGAGWVYGDVRIEGPNGRWRWRPPEALQLRDFEVNNPIAQPGTFISRWALGRIGTVDTSLHYSMDLDLWLRLLAADLPGTYVSQELAVFEVHADSKGGSGIFDRFLVEAAQIRARHGLAAAAAATLGRAAAIRATAGEGANQPIGVALSEVVEESGLALDVEGRRIARASASAELVLQAVRRRRMPDVRHFADPRAWHDVRARRLLLGALRGSLRRVRGVDPSMRW